MDVDRVHKVAEMEEEQARNAFLQHNLRKSTFEMVNFCIREHEINKWEALADEILENNITVSRGLAVAKNFSTAKPP